MHRVFHAIAFHSKPVSELWASPTIWDRTVFLLVVFFVEVICGPLARGVPSAEAPQRAPLESGKRLVELAPVRRTLFTPPPLAPALTPLMEDNMDNTIACEGLTRADWEEMCRMATVLMELFVMFAERFLLEPNTRDNWCLWLTVCTSDWRSVSVSVCLSFTRHSVRLSVNSLSVCLCVWLTKCVCQCLFVCLLRDYYSNCECLFFYY